MWREWTFVQWLGLPKLALPPLWIANFKKTGTEPFIPEYSTPVYSSYILGQHEAYSFCKYGDFLA